MRIQPPLRKNTYLRCFNRNCSTITCAEAAGFFRRAMKRNRRVLSAAQGDAEAAIRKKDKEGVQVIIEQFYNSGASAYCHICSGIHAGLHRLASHRYGQPPKTTDHAVFGGCPIRNCSGYRFTISLSSLPGLKWGIFFAGTLTPEPVLGLRP